MFLFWNRISWSSCNNRYYFFVGWALKVLGLPFDREPSSGLWIRNLVLTFRWRSMAFSVYIGLLLRWLDNKVSSKLRGKDPKFTFLLVLIVVSIIYVIKLYFKFSYWPLLIGIIWVLLYFLYKEQVTFNNNFLNNFFNEKNTSIKIVLPLVLLSHYMVYICIIKILVILLIHYLFTRSISIKQVLFTCIIVTVFTFVFNIENTLYFVISYLGIEGLSIDTTTNVRPTTRSDTRNRQTNETMIAQDNIYELNSIISRDTHVEQEFPKIGSMADFPPETRQKIPLTDPKQDEVKIANLSLEKVSRADKPLVLELLQQAWDELSVHDNRAYINPPFSYNSMSALKLLMAESELHPKTARRYCGLTTKEPFEIKGKNCFILTDKNISFHPKKSDFYKSFQSRFQDYKDGKIELYKPEEKD